MRKEDIKNWTATDGQGVPTWRDGYNGSDRRYLIVAVPRVSTTGYKAIVFGRYYFSGTGKLKFYPSPEACGIDRRLLQNLGVGMGDVKQRGDYVRFIASLDTVKKVLAGLDPQEWMVCPLDELANALAGEQGRSDSRARHPSEGQFVPRVEPKQQEEPVQEAPEVELGTRANPVH